VKRCPKCAISKPLEDFHRARLRRDGRQPYCKPCRAELDHRRYERRVGRPVERGSGPRRTVGENRRAWLLSLKAGRPCTDCGVVYPAVAMQWDHLPGSVKIADVSAMGLYSKDEILAEIAKCELVCTNCHIIRTGKRARWAAVRQVQEAITRYGLSAALWS